MAHEFIPRRLRLVDEAPLLALRTLAVKEELLGPFEHRKQNASPEAVRQLLASTAVTLGVFEGERLLGACTVSYYPFYPGDIQYECGLTGLYVPKRPGEKGRGIGKLLVRSCLNCEEMQPAALCRLEVYSPRIGPASTALAIYLKLGFKETKVLDVDTVAPGMLRHEMKLDLPLPPPDGAQ